MRNQLTVVSSLALAALLWTAGASQAGHGGGGGGHGGGGHGGGGHGGGHGGGGHMGGYGGHGGYHGGYGGGYRGGYGYGGFGIGLYGGLGYPGYGYGNYGSGYGSGYGSYGAGYSGIYNSPINADSGYNSAPVYPYMNAEPYNPYQQGAAALPSTTVNRSLYYSPAEPTDNTAQIRVLVPASAKVWLADEETTLTGSDRLFASPTLEPGKHYTYRVKARWMQDGKPVEKVQKVKVEANQTSTVDFSAPEQSQH